MPEFIPQTPAPANGVRFFNWPDAGEEISESLKMTHACVIPPGASIIHVSGQAGIRSDNTVPVDLTEKIREAFSHIELSLREAGLTGSSEDVWACVYKVMHLDMVKFIRLKLRFGIGEDLSRQYGCRIWLHAARCHDGVLWEKPTSFYRRRCFQASAA